MDSKIATFGSGCFWCTEAVFSRLKGVVSVKSGYAGGQLKNPTYKEVCSGRTGHAEVIQVVYDPATITYQELLSVFWNTHDPTTADRQGNDYGSQYRSIILFHNEEQRVEAEHVKKALNENNYFGKPLVTEIKSFTTFYPAEKYHDQYYDLHPEVPYCQFVIQPKLEKFKSKFSTLLLQSS